MAASFSVNTLQVDFESVLAMEHSGMVGIFKTLENTVLKRFMTATGSVYEAAVGEFFTNAKVIAGTISVLLPIGNWHLSEMRSRFSGSDVLIPAPNKKKEMKMEYRLLHDIIAKVLCAKAGSFDMVTSEKFDLMVAISAGFKVNWAQILF
ncbi:hypothetical protein F511_17089 [Dorcoceras hygrometricum]|uniref:Uncharacterized protein n=1 Tax=Dorcoceras hygrometricum TaxID=472368 RepID=A0A2Z7BM70_9LAMI|nr:hypothetical protein F511_17089 [Dorcoceras hygrometricum]